MRTIIYFNSPLKMLCKCHLFQAEIILTSLTIAVSSNCGPVNNILMSFFYSWNCFLSASDFFSLVAYSWYFLVSAMLFYFVMHIPWPQSQASSITKGMLNSFFMLLQITLRISSPDSKLRTALYSIINSTTGKYFSVAFI